MDLTDYTLAKGGNWVRAMCDWLSQRLVESPETRWESHDVVTLTVGELQELCATFIAGDRIIRESVQERNYIDLKKACFGLLNLDPYNSTSQNVQECEIRLTDFDEKERPEYKTFLASFRRVLLTEETEEQPDVDLLLLASLISTTTVSPAPVQSVRHTPHVSVLIGIGEDGFAEITLEECDLEELEKLTGRKFLRHDQVVHEWKTPEYEENLVDRHKEIHEEKGSKVL